MKPTGVVILTGSQPFTTDLINSNRGMFKYEIVWDKVRPFGFLDSKIRPMKKHENILVFSNAGCSNGSKPQMLYNPQGLKYAPRINKKSKSNILNSEPQNASAFAEYTNYPSSILTVNVDNGAEHPTQKPVGLFEYLIRTYTNENDLVFDGFGGSGTTAIAASKCNRHFIVIEKEKKYFDAAQKRLTEFRSQLKLAI